MLTPPPRPQAPEAPVPEECCNSGCEPCILDLYTEELAKYRHDLAEWERLYGNAGQPDQATQG